jgi:TrmH family RNA methyltransferase
LITSLSNPHVKEIKHLKDRKYRSESSLCYIEGLRIVYEALLQGIDFKEILISPELSRSDIIIEIQAKAKANGIPITELSKDVFESISTKDGPQGLAAVVKQKWFSLDVISKAPGFWVALYEVADPGNLGTILRTCDGVGASGVILIGNCTDPYDPTSVRASMGAVFSQKIIRSTIDEFHDCVKSNSRIVIGTSDHAQIDYRKVNYVSNTILLMGSERQGIPVDLEKICHEIVLIPMRGSCDSLNLAVATSILLYEIYRNTNEKEKA